MCDEADPGGGIVDECQAEDAGGQRIPFVRWLGLLGAPLLAVVVYLLIPAARFEADGKIAAGLTQPGRAVAAVGILMAVLWVTEALPIPVTALIPMVLFPLATFGVVDVKAAAAPYANDLIFLFMGGFLLAQAMQRWGLHRRIALHTILLVGTRPAGVVAGFMLASGFLSMWVSNTATVVMMLPIALSVIELVRQELARRNDPQLPPRGAPFHFAICLLLGTAYAASIGGIATLIGTPPNAMLAAYVGKTFNIQISFVRWMMIGVPLAAVLLPLTWLLLTRIVYPIRLRQIPGGRELIARELQRQGPMTRAEAAVLVVFVLTAVGWITRPWLAAIRVGDSFQPLAGLSDSGIAVAAAVVLFACPIYPGKGEFLLTWRQARTLPWGVLLLFGGGLSLAEAVKLTGVAEFIGHGVSGLHGWSVALLVLLVITLIVFLTELTSNTATTATLLPILGPAAVGLGLSPLLFVVPMTIGASCAFMMPVGTPPNAIVFSSGELKIWQMCKAGFWLNLISIAVIFALTYLFAGPLLGQ
ncbi:MAG TPA: SLC13 family permease [Phycisphaerae bacterium]|nr:SLC13 family permease [Phycisphaerae bacterium]HNU44705.1 SLC13 family permease [Phycisphaerae bacterium]